MAKKERFQEFHEDQSEFFDMYNATRKNKTGFPAFATLVATAAIAVSTALTMSMYINVSTIAMSPNNAVLNVNIINEDTDGPIEYFIYESDKSKTKKDYQNSNDYVQKGTIECKDTALEIDMLSPSTEYVVVFKATDDRQKPFLGTYLFETGDILKPNINSNSAENNPYPQNSNSNTNMPVISDSQQSSNIDENSDSLQNSQSATSSQGSSSIVYNPIIRPVITPAPTPQAPTYIAPRIEHAIDEISKDANSAYVEANVIPNNGTIDSYDVTISANNPNQNATVFEILFVDNILKAYIRDLVLGNTYTITYSVNYTLPDGSIGKATQTFVFEYDITRPVLNIQEPTEINTQTKEYELSLLGVITPNDATFNIGDAYSITVDNDGVISNVLIIQNNVGEYELVADLSNIKHNTTYTITYSATYTLPDGSKDVLTGNQTITHSYAEPTITANNVIGNTQGLTARPFANLSADIAIADAEIISVEMTADNNATVANVKENTIVNDTVNYIGTLQNIVHDTNYTITYTLTYRLPNDTTDRQISKTNTFSFTYNEPTISVNAITEFKGQLNETILQLESVIIPNDAVLNSGTITVENNLLTAENVGLSVNNYGDNILTGNLSGIQNGQTYTIIYTVNYSYPDGTSDIITARQSYTANLTAPEIISISMQDNTNPTVGGETMITAIISPNDGINNSYVIKVSDGVNELTVDNLTENIDNQTGDITITGYISNLSADTQYTAIIDLTYKLSLTDTDRVISKTSAPYRLNNNNGVIDFKILNVTYDAFASGYKSSVTLPIEIKDTGAIINQAFGNNGVDISISPIATDVTAELVYDIVRNEGGTDEIILDMYNCTPGTTIPLEISVGYILADTESVYTKTVYVDIPHLYIDVDEIIVGDNQITLSFALGGNDANNSTIIDLTVETLTNATGDIGYIQITDLYNQNLLNNYVLQIATDGFTFNFRAQIEFTGTHNNGALILTGAEYTK